MDFGNASTSENYMNHTNGFCIQNLSKNKHNNCFVKEINIQLVEHIVKIQARRMPIKVFDSRRGDRR